MYGFIEMIHGDTLKTLVVIQSIYISVTTILYENLKKNLGQCTSTSNNIICTHTTTKDGLLYDRLVNGWHGRRFRRELYWLSTL